MGNQTIVEGHMRRAATEGAMGARDACLNAEELSEFERRLRECHRIVFQVAYGVLRDRSDAEEIAQDAFLRAFQRFASLRDVERFRCWVARAAFRMALNRRRTISRAMRRDRLWLEERPQTSNAEQDAEEDAIGREFEMQLRGAIDRLPEKLREVVLLSAVEELETREIAAILEIPEGTVRSRKHVARRQLLEELCHEDLR
jgi:RNA polymerase sigma-70 factor (ECF subfamily)